MTSPTVPPALAAAHALDPALIENARADAERLVSAMPRDHAPVEEPAHTFLADQKP